MFYVLCSMSCPCWWMSTTEKHLESKTNFPMGTLKYILFYLHDNSQWTVKGTKCDCIFTFLVTSTTSNCVRWTFFPPFKVNNRNYPKLKEVDDVLGGAAAWENVDSTPGKWQKVGLLFYTQAPHWFYSVHIWKCGSVKIYIDSSYTYITPLSSLQ